MPQKILLTGINGQVGHALHALLANDSKSSSLFALDRAQLDLSNSSEIRRVVQSIKPDLIINPAAYTAVDKAETEPDLAFAINAIAPQILAEEAAKSNARLIHFSTDYVYDGAKASPYLEDDPTSPLSVYGKSKLAGEIAIRASGVQHLIFRTSWVYGAYGKNFLKTILRLAGEREELRIVADQFGAPTSSASIAEGVISAIKRWDAQQGTYHLVNAGATTWHGFASAIIEGYQQIEGNKASLKAKEIHAISTAEFPTPAKRPENSRLDTSKLARDFSITLPDWQDALNAEIVKI